MTYSSLRFAGWLNSLLIILYKGHYAKLPYRKYQILFRGVREELMQFYRQLSKKVPSLAECEGVQCFHILCPRCQGSYWLPSFGERLPHVRIRCQTLTLRERPVELFGWAACPQVNLIILILLLSNFLVEAICLLSVADLPILLKFNVLTGKDWHASRWNQNLAIVLSSLACLRKTIYHGVFRLKELRVEIGISNLVDVIVQNIYCLVQWTLKHRYNFLVNRLSSSSATWTLGSYSWVAEICHELFCRGE